MPRSLLLSILLCLGVSALPLLKASAIYSPQQERVDFRKQIEPIFQQSCYHCHAGNGAMAGLRLDARASAMKVIVPGHSQSSRLLHRLLGQGGEPRMPLGGQPLAPAQIALIRRWIEEGADWPEPDAKQSLSSRHWAFVAPARPPLPAVKNQAWARNPIDYFILAELEKRGLTPSPEAPKETLIRRLSLDLTGLPPTIEEIDNFVNDKSPEAYERLVERLLASPHYGERWGRWWLDVARYADTNGFEKDRSRSIWPYRDWVIKAFNHDLPFDQFTIEQLAGDLLPNPTLEQRVATGFLRNSMLNEEGGVDPEQFRVEGIIDRVDTIGKAFLGLTINCAQCHAHKFDPISQKEYYQFYAFLNSDDEPEIEVPSEEVLKKRREILAQVSQIEDELTAKDADLPKRMAAWEERVRKYEDKWVVLVGAETFAAFGTKFDRLEDGSYLAKGDNSTNNNYLVKAKTHLKNITGFRVEFLTDPNLPRRGPGRAPDGSFFFTEFSVEAAPLDKPEAAKKVEWADVVADFSLPDFPAKNVIDGNLKTHWSSDAGPGRRNQNRQFLFIPQKAIGFEKGTLLTFQLAQKADEMINVMLGGKPNIGRFRLSVTTDEQPQLDPVPAPLRQLLSIPPGQRTREQQREVFSFYRTLDPACAEANKKIDQLMKDWPYGVTTLALMARPRPRETRIFKRGDWKNPAEVVTPGTPSALHPFPQDAPLNRLGLARWIVDKSNPLTPRVIVNRIWQQYFGQGLVTTPEDFGSRCEMPSHPELLDWLACEFRDRGWSFKHIHRLIVNSALYRQSSKVTPALLEVDPTNRFLARAPRLRVEAEIIRDIALSASGLLSKKIGGPSVFPPLPDGVMALAYGGFKWEPSSGEDRYRRGMYTFWKRSVPYPGMAVFDAPNADFACTRRVRSNTPLQALTTLNDTVFMEAAQALAFRVWKAGGGDDRSKMIYAFRLCTGRKPDAFELQRLMAFLQEQQRYFDGRTAAAVYVSATDLNKIPEEFDLHKVAPWVMVARLLLNLDETITKE